MPSPARNAALAAASTERPVIESDSDITATVVTHAVFARIAGDEEWRGKYTVQWPGVAAARMETADNAMYTQFGIDFRHFDSVAWDSADTSRATCTILSEQIAEVPRGSADVVVGYIHNPVTGGTFGCAGSRSTIVKWHGNDETQALYNMWVTSQHEFGHLFNAPDRYGAQAASHQNDVMEDHYNYPSFWCKQTGYNDWGLVNSAAGSYD